LFVPKHFELKDGFVVIADRPGAGIDRDEKAVRRYRVSSRYAPRRFA